MSLQARLQALAAFLPPLTAPGFQFGTWQPMTTSEDGVHTLPYFQYGPVADALVKVAYEAGWVLAGFDWGSWLTTDEALQLRDDPRALQQATPDQLARLLTALIRQDRFVEGGLQGHFESGLLTGILQRAEALAAASSGEKRP